MEPIVISFKEGAFAQSLRDYVRLAVDELLANVPASKQVDVIVEYADHGTLEREVCYHLRTQYQEIARRIVRTVQKSGCHSSDIIKRRYRCDRIEPGLYSQERTVTFSACAGTGHVVIDESDLLSDNTMIVTLVETKSEESLIDLPGDSFQFGTRVKVPTDKILPWP